MKKFGKTLKKFREKKNISKVKLAKTIGTSDAYIRQIENQGYKPPTFELCEKICFELSLKMIEKKELYEAAFLERIESEKDFYNFLKQDIFPSKNTKNQILLEFQPLIENNITQNLEKIEKIILSNLNQSKINGEILEISSTDLVITTKNKLDSNLIKEVESLMNKTSNEIKNELDGFNGVHLIWKNEIKTNENERENLENKIKSSAPSIYVTQL